MFEYGPDGRRRLSKFGQRVVVMVILVAMVLVTTVWLVAHRQAGESAGGIITAGFALAGTLGMGILTWGQGRRIEELTYAQNEKLEQIHSKVEGEYPTVAAIREEWRRDRHDLKDQKAAQQLRAELAESELRTAESEKAKLESQVRELTDKLGRVAERGAAKPGDANC